MSVGGIRAKGTNFKTDELKDAIIERYRIVLKMINKDSNDSDNELTLSAFSVTNFRNPTSAMNKIQVIKSILDTPSSLITATYAAKKDTWPETVLK